MSNNLMNIFKQKKNGFSLLEVIVSLTVFSMILLSVISFIFSMNTANLKTKADREASENAKIALERMTYDIRSAKSIYTPTTTASQLSLETVKYLPAEVEKHTFIDFFLCGSAVCFKKESQDPVAITSSSVEVTNLVFSQITTGSTSSVQINLTVRYPGSGNGKDSSIISLTSTASLRSY